MYEKVGLYFWVRLYSTGHDIVRNRGKVLENFLRNRANVSQMLLLNFSTSRMQESAGVRRARCATRTASAQLGAALKGAASNGR